MKKSNILLAICSFLALVCYLFVVKYDVIVSYSLNALLQALASTLILVTLFLCFVFKNRTVLLLCILLSSGFAFFVVKEAIYLYLPLLMGIWFMKTVEQKPHFVEIIPYCLSQVFSTVMGTYILMRSSFDSFRKVLPKLRIAAVIVMAVIFAAQVVIALVLRSRKKKNLQTTQKEWGKRLDNYKVTFYFLEAFIVILNVAFYMNNPASEAQPVAFAVLKIGCAAYCIGKLYLLGGNEIGWLSKLKKQWQA